MAKLILAVTILMCATFALGEKKGGPVLPLSDRLCCECCASYGPCGCQICSYCPLTKTGHEVERSMADLDKLQSLGVRVYFSSQPLMAGQSRKCPKVEALLEKK